MSRTVFFFILLFAGISSFASQTKSASDVCLEFLEKGGGYSIILKNQEPYVLLTRPLASKNALSLAGIMARHPGGSAIVKSLPELAKLHWVKSGTLEYYAHADGIFGRIIRFHISKDAFFAVEIRLELGELNRELVGQLVGPLERNGVNALISGNGTQLSIYRLDLNELKTRGILKLFLRFLKKCSTDSVYAEAIARSRSL